jgi:hypothetical protein
MPSCGNRNNEFVLAARYFWWYMWLNFRENFDGKPDSTKDMFSTVQTFEVRIRSKLQRWVPAHFSRSRARSKKKG